MNDNIIKEIIKTTTEKFNAEGVVIERVTEEREKTFGGKPQDINLPPVQPAPANIQLPEAPHPEINKELLDNVANKIDASNQQQQQVQQNPSGQNQNPVYNQQRYAPQGPPQGYTPLGGSPYSTNQNPNEGFRFDWEK